MLQNLLTRLANIKTTLMGTALGGASAAVVHQVLTEAGCRFDGVDWGAVGAFTAAQLVGMLAHDKPKGPAA